MSARRIRLTDAFHVRRRYGRSVNLERDLGVAGTLEGYVTSPLVHDVAERIVGAWTEPRTTRAWTLTGVYGTGKSAFAHFLGALWAPSRSVMRKEAVDALRGTPEGTKVAKRILRRIPSEGVLLAVATSQREPLTVTVLRALARAADVLASTSRQPPAVVGEVRAALDASGEELPTSRAVVDFAVRLASAHAGGMCLIIDELGKCLEFAARDQRSADDVYLLQLLAENTVGEHRLGVIGLLHQGFGEYGAGLPMDRRTEWLKIQGRFEDIVFAQPADQMLRLVANAIEPDVVPGLESALQTTADAWRSRLTELGPDRHVLDVLSAAMIRDVLPLHPVAALVLPVLCSKYAQNDRSLFTFVAGQEPHAFGRFLRENAWEGERLPLQRLGDVYDYFAGIAGHSVGFRPQFQRWAEVNAVVSDARSLDAESVLAIKTIAALNLTAASGSLRASRALTVAALVEDPESAVEVRRWSTVLDGLVERGLITYRRQLDEYRLWEGSDFDVEEAIRTRRSQRRVPLAKVLADAVPVEPLVAQRHSYRTGTLRYFERDYTEDPSDLQDVRCRHEQSDGVLLYWIGRGDPGAVPAKTREGHPVVVVEARDVAELTDAAAEFLALEEIAEGDPHLQTDGVARREVRHRQGIARAALDRAVRQTLFGPPLRCHFGGETRALTATALRARLSDLCEDAYQDSLVLWNELINRRDLTSQGTKARRKLIEAMIVNGAQERLGLKGNGPETSMYSAVLERSGIHRRDGAHWIFDAPTHPGFVPVWTGLLEQCQDATDTPLPVDELFARMKLPPYGIKEGVLPVLFVAALLAEANSLNLYREGSFLPALGAEHFEVLVKQPAKFAVKHFALEGLRAEVFRDLEDAVRRATGGQEGGAGSILDVVRPLVRFANGLPPITLRTADLTPTATAVRNALRTAREPDRLIFHDLPVACGLQPITVGQTPEPSLRVEYRTRVVAALREMQSFPERRRSECRGLLATAFGDGNAPVGLRKHLSMRVRALGTQPVEERLRAFVLAAGDESSTDTEWLDALIMVVSDRPLRSWTDDDAVGFEGHVAELMRRFRNLEALHANAALVAPEDEVRRLTVTAPDGSDIHRVVWIRGDDQNAIRTAAQSVLGQLEGLSTGQREAVLAILAELILAVEADPPTADEPLEPQRDLNPVGVGGNHE
jgi:hypothetical protein